MRRIITVMFAIFVTSVISIQAQEIISTNGNFDEFSGGSISWTMGEPIMETISGGTNTLTQGFQQTELNVITSIESFSTCQGDITVPIKIQNISNVASFSISLGFTFSELMYDHYQNVNPVLATGSLSVVSGPDAIIISWTSATPVSIGNETLLELSFSAISTSNLNWNASSGSSQYKDLADGVFPTNFVDATITVQPLATADAGDNVSICLGETYTVHDASADYYNSLLWTGGQGFISNDTSLTPTYIPASAESGPVVLTLTAESNSPCTVPAVSYKTIFIQETPYAYAGLNVSILPGEDYLLVDASALFHGLLLWETSGDGGFSNLNELNPTYFSGDNDKAAGFVELTLTAPAISPCAINAVGQMGLTIFRPPTVEILSPIDGDIFDDFPITVDGIAADPDGDLLDVYVSLNNDLWELATGLYPWSKALILDVGENSIRAKSVDSQGLESDITEITITAGIQIIALSQGWSAISSFLTPIDPAMEMVMADVGIPGNLTIMLGELGIFWPDYNINSIGNWNSYEGYKVKYKQVDELIVRGDNLSDNSVTYSVGFHIIPVLSNVPSLISQIFSDPVNDVKYIYDLTSGLIYWPDGGITNLVELLPGRGYLASFNKEVTIDFPDYQNLKSASNQYVPVAEQSGPWDYSRSGIVHQFSIENMAAAEFDGVTHTGAFNSNGTCIGSAEVNHSNGNYLLTVYGDDETTTANDGALEEETLSFKAFNSEQNLEYELTPDFSSKMPDVDGKFKTNGLSSIVSFKESSTGVGSSITTLSVELFPNPARDMVTLVCLNYSEDDQFEVKFVNAGGKLSKRIQLTGQSTSIDLEGLNRGVYFVKITSLTGTVIKKLVIQ